MRPHNVIQLFGHPRKLEEKKNRHFPKKNSDMKQLSLPFAEPHSLVLLMASAFKAPDDFLRFTSIVNSYLILDIRMAPRLDFIGFNRSQSFGILKSLGIDYKDMLGRANIKPSDKSKEKHKNLWESLVSHINQIKNFDHPIILFFDNENLMSECEKTLSSIYKITILEQENIKSISENIQLRM